MSETIQITEDYRLIVTPDENASDPRDWNPGSEVDPGTLSLWQAGRVYIVASQERQWWARLDESGQPIRLTAEYRWMDVDSIGECYLTDEYTAQVVASEHFENYPVAASA
jgi:hypothetical protein